MDGSTIAERTREFLAELPPSVRLVAAAKTRSVDDVRAALAAGVSAIGENYVQEAAAMQAALGREAAEWHLIGHLQRNKAKDAVRRFDLIHTVDSLRLGEALDAAGRALGRVVLVLVEVNSGREPQKAGVAPEEAADLIRELDKLQSVQVLGLMTLGPAAADPEALRAPFRETRRLFEALRAAPLERGRIEILSMGMSDSYPVAIEEGATLVRIGTGIFGPRV